MFIEKLSICDISRYVIYPGILDIQVCDISRYVIYPGILYSQVCDISRYIIHPGMLYIYPDVFITLWVTGLVFCLILIFQNPYPQQILLHSFTSGFACTR